MAALFSLDPVIETTHGKLRGNLRKSVYGDSYFSFEGVPYAKPPIGELRFKAPQDLEPWQGVRDSMENPPDCVQYNRFVGKVVGSEDCLFLNIYAKTLRSPKPLPVMVYLFGGVFSHGVASRKDNSPDYFMMKDVIVINVGFRLGALGFLTLSDPSVNVPGNATFKDIVKALKWIKSNCANFNGDPDNITLFGHSSGSTSTLMLMQSPKSVGLFHKAILMSGFGFHIHTQPDIAYRFAKHIGFEGENNDKDIYNFLKGVSSEKLVDTKFLTDEEHTRGFFIPFGPCIEPYETDDSILLKEPIEYVRTSWGNSIPVLMGNTSMEIMASYVKSEEFLKSNPEFLLPTEVQRNANIELQKKLSKKLMEIHGKHSSHKEIVDELTSYQTILHPAHRVMLARRSNPTNARTYFYRFSLDSPNFNLWRIKRLGPEARGLAHGDELSYLLYIPESFKLPEDSIEFKTIRRMVDIFSSFAASSDPNCPMIAPVVWEPLDRNNPDLPAKCLDIDHEVSFIDWPEEVTCKKLDELYEESGTNLF